MHINKYMQRHIYTHMKVHTALIREHTHQHAYSHMHTESTHSTYIQAHTNIHTLHTHKHIHTLHTHANTHRHILCTHHTYTQMEKWRIAVLYCIVLYCSVLYCVVDHVWWLGKSLHTFNADTGDLFVFKVPIHGCLNLWMEPLAVEGWLQSPIWKQCIRLIC